MPSLLEPIVAGSPEAVPERLQRYSRYVLLLSGSEPDGFEATAEPDTETEEEEDQERERWTLIHNGALQAAHSIGHPFFRAGSYRAPKVADAKVDLRF